MQKPQEEEGEEKAKEGDEGEEGEEVEATTSPTAASSTATNRAPSPGHTQPGGPQEAPIPLVCDRWGNAIQVPGYTYRVSQQPEWLQRALKEDKDHMGG